MRLLKTVTTRINQKVYNNIQNDVENCTRYKIGFQSFENCEIIAFPHPATQGGICDHYIASFFDEIKPKFESFINHKT